MEHKIYFSTLARRVFFILLAWTSICSWSATLEQMKGSKADSAALQAAADAGNVADIRKLLGKGVPVDVRDDDGWTPLMTAAGRGQLDAVKIFLAAGADIETQSVNGQTPLMAAVASGSSAMVKLLVERGANTHAEAANGITVARIALKLGDPTIIGLVGANGSKVNTSTKSFRNSSVSDVTERAISALDAKQYSIAVPLFQQLTELTPQDPLAWHFLGEAMIGAGDKEGARNALTHAISISGTNTEAARRSQSILDSLRPVNLNPPPPLVCTPGPSMPTYQITGARVAYGSIGCDSFYFFGYGSLAVGAEELKQLVMSLTKTTCPSVATLIELKSFSEFDWGYRPRYFVVVHCGDSDSAAHLTFKPLSQYIVKPLENVIQVNPPANAVGIVN
ncbi:MAG: ankyrin repeat domain-containing protein [Paucibacter sp.]|nr:ankyrin repeat domain-containing protein [Roseateles sp.]